jgi:hypothetical protein
MADPVMMSATARMHRYTIFSWGMVGVRSIGDSPYVATCERTPVLTVEPTKSAELLFEPLTPAPLSRVIPDVPGKTVVEA